MLIKKLLFILPIIALAGATVPASALHGSTYVIERDGIKIVTMIGDDDVTVTTTTPTTEVTNTERYTPVMPRFMNTGGLELSQDQEVHEVVGSDASGTVRARLDTRNNVVRVNIRYRNLSSPLLFVGGMDTLGNAESAAHVHVGDMGSNGPIAFNLEFDTLDTNRGTAQGAFRITDEQKELFLSDGYYINLHTENNPMGELRGQLRF